MPMPANFSAPTEEPHRYFRNLCIEFKKAIHSSKDLNLLQDEMEKFINASKQMNWHHKDSGKYHKDAGEKAAGKVWKEFDRYFRDLSSNPDKANAQDLLEALAVVEGLIQSSRVT